MHKSVLLEECLEYLNIQEESIIVDCTLGYGGHSSNILKKIKKCYTDYPCKEKHPDILRIYFQLFRRCDQHKYNIYYCSHHHSDSCNPDRAHIASCQPVHEDRYASPQNTCQQDSYDRFCFPHYCNLHPSLYHLCSIRSPVGNLS